MSTKNIRAEAFDVRIVGGLRCPHCDKALSPHAVERYDQNAWRMLCASCHRDVLVIEPAE